MDLPPFIKCLENLQEESFPSTLQIFEAAHIQIDKSNSAESTFGSRSSTRTNAFVQFFDKQADANTGQLVYKCKIENCDYLSRLKITEDALRKHIMKFHKNIYDGVKQQRVPRKSDSQPREEPNKADSIDTNLKLGTFVNVDFNGRIVRMSSDKISAQRLEKLFHLSMIDHQLLDSTNKTVVSQKNSSSFYDLTGYSQPFKVVPKSNVTEKCKASENLEEPLLEIDVLLEQPILLQSIENKEGIKIVKVEELLAEDTRASFISQSSSAADEQDKETCSPPSAISQKAKRVRKRNLTVDAEEQATHLPSKIPAAKEEPSKIKGAPKKSFIPLQNVKVKNIEPEKQWLSHLLDRFGNCQLCSKPIQNDFLTCVQCGQLAGCTNCMLALCQQQLTKCPRCSSIWDFRSFQVNYSMGNFLFPFAMPNAACCQLISELRDQFNS